MDALISVSACVVSSTDSRVGPSPGVGAFEYPARWDIDLTSDQAECHFGESFSLEKEQLLREIDHRHRR